MFQLTLVTPEKTIAKALELAEITLPAHSGELNILPGHTPLMTTLTAGRIAYRLNNGETHEFVLAWGYCQVTDGQVLVLAENVKSAHELDRQEILSQIKTWDDRLQKESMDDEQYQSYLKAMVELRSQADFLKI